MNLTFKILLLTIVVTSYSCGGQQSSSGSFVQSDGKITGDTVHTLYNQIWSIFQDQNKNYWFGSNGEGLYSYNGKTLVRFTVKHGLVDDAIRGIQADSAGNLYIETPAGVSRFDGQRFTTLVPKSGPDIKWELSDDDLWFNCNGNPSEVYRYDGETMVELALPRRNIDSAFGREVRGVGFKDMNHSPYSVYGLDKDGEGNLWIGTISAGAFRFDGTSFLWVCESELSTLPDGRVPGVRSMLEDVDGKMWLSNFISKYEIVEKGNSLNYIQLPSVLEPVELDERNANYFNSGLVAKNGDLWMTTYGGGVWTYKDGQLQKIEVEYENEPVLLIGIHEDGDGVIWVGSNNFGVFYFDGGKFIRFHP